MELRVTVFREDADVVSDVLWTWEPSAIEEQAATGTALTLVAGFADRERAERGAAAVADLASRIEMTDITDEPWLDRWRDHARHVRVGRFVIAPAWLDAPSLDGPVVVDEDTILLRLDPGRAFGSGSHPTTRLMLGAVEQLVTPGTTVLDVGCGSGVLAVAAAAIGASSVVAIDVDPAAVAATIANARAHDVDDRVAASDDPLAEVDGQFDVVLANLLASTIEALADDLVARAAPGGRLVLSGLLEDRWPATAAQFPTWSVAAVDAEDGWVAITLVGSSPSSLPCPP